MTRLNKGRPSQDTPVQHKIASFRASSMIDRRTQTGHLSPFCICVFEAKHIWATVDGQTLLQVVSLLGAQSSTGHLYLCICNFCICVFISISICWVKQDLARAHLVYKLIACWNLIWTFLEFKLWATWRSSKLEKTRYGHWTQNKATMSKKKHRPFVRHIKVVLCVSGDQEYISTSLRQMSAR